MKFENVSIEIAGNSYFDGAVTSRTINFPNGTRKTLGFMQDGAYEFGTNEAELMEVTAGELHYKLADAEWQVAKAGESFNVPANSKFQVEAKGMVDYCCSYL